MQSARGNVILVDAVYERAQAKNNYTKRLARIGWNEGIIGMHTKRWRELLLPTLLFALYIFAFLLTEFTVNERCAAVFGADSVTAVYAVGIVCTSVGYAGFYLSRKWIKSESRRKLLLALYALAHFAATLCFIFCPVPAAFMTAALLALLLFGYIGGFTHYTVSLLLFGKSWSGKAIGCAIALAILLQFAVQNLLSTDIALIVSLLLSVCGLLYLAWKPVKDWMFENPLPYAATPSVTPKDLLLPVLVVGVMSLCHGLGDGIITHLHAIGAVDLASYSRLLYAAGALIAGIVADRTDRRLLPLCTLCLLMLLSAMALFIGDGSTATNTLYVSATYLFGGFYVMYLTVTFLDAAPMTDKPDLWAGMGRIVRGLCIGLTAAVSNPLLMSIGLRGIVIVGACLSIAALILLVAGGGLNLRPQQPAPEKNRMSEFITAHQLTPREAEVLAALLDNRQTNRGIANDLYISTRVLERYITSLYEKTETKTRIELIDLYYDRKDAPQEPFPAAEPEQPVTPKRKRRAIPGGKLSAEKAAAAAERYDLTRREAELMEQVYGGKTNEEIATELGISENTVKFHLKNLMKKMSASSRTEIKKSLDEA